MLVIISIFFLFVPGTQTVKPPGPQKLSTKKLGEVFVYERLKVQCLYGTWLAPLLSVSAFWMYCLLANVQLYNLYSNYCTVG